MKPLGTEDLQQLSMLELFRLEADTQTATLSAGLLELERGAPAGPLLESLMRAAHSLKGAARIVNLSAVVRVAHAIEDCFVAAQKGTLSLGQAEIDRLLRGVDLLMRLAKGTESDIARWELDHTREISELLEARARWLGQDSNPPSTPAAEPLPYSGDTASGPPAAASEAAELIAPDSGSLAPSLSAAAPEPVERVLRLTAENLNRLLGLAGESLVESHWLRPFADSLHRFKREQIEIAGKIERLRQLLDRDPGSERVQSCFDELSHQVADSHQFLGDRLQELDRYDRRSAMLSQRLYYEVLRTRMRPFSDGVRRFPRMVRDLARALGKQVRLEILGENTQVDRDILERLETPLAHLLRNAVDHGCELPAVRRAAGKPPEATLRIEAHHSAGVLLVTVTDDGAGVRLDRLRQVIVQKSLAPPAAAEQLPESELLEFLFLTGLSLKETVTEISGRGVGLDVVQNMVRSLRGSVRLSQQAGRGLRVQLQLPLTLSVVRALLVEVAGEPYAIPLGQISRTLRVPPRHVASLEGRLHCQFAGQQVGLLTAHQLLDCGDPKPPDTDLPVVVLGERNARQYGLIVDRFLGQRELVVQPVDPRLGKIQDVSAAAIMEEGTPVVILDVEELLRSIERISTEGRPARFPIGGLELPAPRRKRVLAVDDSLTVRELERKLLAARGYQADVAGDGLEAWNAIRSGHYDLVVTDVDMPRMDGIELMLRLRNDARFKRLPVVMVSYQDGEGERRRGLEAGVDYYLTKGDFQEEIFVQAVVDLIGEPV